MVASIQEQLQQLFPHVLGMQLQAVTTERVVARLIVRPELCTVGEILHGGAIMTFADTLGAVATIVNLRAGSRTTTIESKTNFVGAARLNTEVIGECTPLHRGKQTMVWQTKVQSAEGRLIAVVTQTQLVLE
jgi:1,4-dihydroxy-2-naphthoyl-CoA hydrolase